MSHRVHPKIFRIKSLKDWQSRGFYGKKMPIYLKEDYIIKTFLKERLKDASVADVEIKRSKEDVKVIVKTSRPGLVIGRGGEVVEKVKKELAKEIEKAKKKDRDTSLPNINIEIKEVRNPWTSASLIGQWIAEQIEKRTPYRQVLKRALNKVEPNKEVKGVRIEVAGRLNGIEISRTEWLKSGNVPRQTIRADIDYAFTEAHCRYGSIGIKVWLYKGERTEE